MTALIIQGSTAGMFLTVIVAAIHWSRRSDDRIRRRRWKHVALAFLGLLVTVVPWMVLVGQDFRYVEWRWLFTSAMPWLTLFGVLLFLQGTLFDLSRDRICRRCGFDLRMQDGLRCVDCGRVAKSEAHLRAIRPSRTLQVVAIIVAATAFWQWRAEAISGGGWRGLVPDVVLVTFWPWLPDTLVHGADWPIFGAPGMRGTLTWRLSRGSERLTDAQRASIVRRAFQHAREASTPRELVAAIGMLSLVGSSAAVRPLTRQQIDLIVDAMEAETEPNLGDAPKLASLLAQFLPFDNTLQPEAMEALLLRRDAIDSIAQRTPPSELSESAGMIVLTLHSFSGELSREILLREVLGRAPSRYMPPMARMFPRDPGLADFLMDAAAAGEDGDALTIHIAMLAVEEQRWTNEATVDRFVGQVRERMGRGVGAPGAPDGVTLARMIGKTEVVRAAFGPSWRVYAAPGTPDAVGLLELFEAGLDADTTRAIESRRADFEALIADGHSALGVELVNVTKEMDRTAQLVAQQLGTGRQQRVSSALQVAAILAWEAACQGGRHEPAASFIQAMRATDRTPWDNWAWFDIIEAELRWIGAIGDADP